MTQENNPGKTSITKPMFFEAHPMLFRGFREWLGRILIEPLEDPNAYNKKDPHDYTVWLNGQNTSGKSKKSE